MAHLVPLGAPSYLLPIMVLIESVSNLIRPLTLSVRLIANMVAGHLLLVLVRTFMIQRRGLIGLVEFFGLLSLVGLELAVACIQGYVFCMLGVLYVAEINVHKTNFYEFSLCKM